MSQSAPTIPESHALSARLSHPCFPQPPDPNVKVWRYMDLAKLISIIQSRELYLARLDHLADPYEGSTTQLTATGIDTFLKNVGSQNSYKDLSGFYRKSRESTFVSCWHTNEHESEAMWRLYAGLGGGIAVQTTYAKLVNSIEQFGEVYIGLVRYIDYSTALFPDANAFYPVMHKRASFAHEREVRLVWYWGAPLEPDSSPISLSIPWDIEAFAEQIFVDPYAPAYYFEAVKAILSSMAPSLASRLAWSKMKIDPVF
jgi:hypothetical protein